MGAKKSMWSRFFGLDDLFAFVLSTARVLTFSIFFCVLASPEQGLALLDKSSKKTSVDVNFSVEGQSYEEGVNELKGSTFSLRMEAFYLISPRLKFDLSGEFQWNSSNVQLRSKKDYSTAPIKLNQAAVRFQLNPHLEFLFGSISQGFLDAPLLISDRGFPGILEKFYWKSSLLNLRFTAEQTIPTSTSFNFERTGQEATPYFFVEMIELEFKPLQNLYIETQAIHYSYKSLPSVVAARSSALGNTITGSLNNSAFAEEFNGVLLGAEVGFSPLEDLNFSISHQILKNFKADSNGKGQYTKFQVTKEWSSDLYIRVSYEKYFKDRDVVPALYSHLRYGGNNRKGNAYHLSLDFLDYGFSLKAGHYDNRILSVSPYQQDSLATYIAMESEVVKF